jgi:hypothetical protein
MNQIPVPMAPPQRPSSTEDGAGEDPAPASIRTWHPAARFGAVAVAALLLLWPGFWNGYPLVFADTGTYLGQALQVYLGWDRPPFYSAFLFATHWRLTLWGPVLAQALIVAHLLAVTLTVLGRPNPWLAVPVAFGLAALTGLPWLAAQLIPDVFTGVVVLALWLLGFRAEALSRGERLWLWLLATGSIAVHQSHVPLAFGLVVCGAALLLAWHGPRPALAAAARMAVPGAVAVAALVAVNLAGHGRASPSPFGSVFLAARLIYDGPAMDMLRRTCPAAADAAWRVCPFLDRLGPGHNAFLWEPASPLHRELGGPKAWAAEASAIVAATMREAPDAVTLKIIGNTVEQFRQIDTGDGLEPWPGVPGPEPLIAGFFPRRELDRFLAGRQQQGALLADAQAVAPLHRAVALCGLLALAVLPALFWRRFGVAGVALALLVLAAAIGNAAITGGLSGPAVRYQARLAWLFVFAPAALALAAPAAASGAASVRQAIKRRQAA